jgi:TrmH RNA methyltransferase
MRPKEIPVCGLAAVQAVFAKNPDAIKRVFFDYTTGRKVAKLSSYLAKTKKIYRVLEPAELEKVAGTVHHGGIVAIVEQRGLREPRPDDVRAWAAARAPLVLLDRIGNAHNLGAIARTAAFLGVERMIIPDHPQQAVPGEAAYRVAEGGLEHVELFQVKNLAAFCRELAPRYDVVGTAVTGKSIRLDQWASSNLPDRNPKPASSRPLALVLGNEEQGMSAEVTAACHRLVTIPGSGRVESLNVSVAAAILMWTLFGVASANRSHPGG